MPAGRDLSGLRIAEHALDAFDLVGIEVCGTVEPVRRNGGKPREAHDRQTAGFDALSQAHDAFPQ
jgi:hypothetical protein